MNLPEEFLERMKAQLGDDYAAFYDSYSNERTYGLRRNPLKLSQNAFEAVMEENGFLLERVEWSKEGYYYQPQAQPGKHPLHEAGAYYIQEPSAMSVVELLQPQPGERICDLCAAPGGKSTQIAGRMAGRGFLLANEYVPNRAAILSQNIERMGVGNAVVCNEDPGRLAERFPGFFDRVLVDAPCSGEGMFRKDENARSEWSVQQVELCARRQREILSCAKELLCPGGILVYSTCTFSRQENEENAAWFLKENPEFSFVREMRILPHEKRGEGHYAVCFRKDSGVAEAGDRVQPTQMGKADRGKHRKRRKDAKNTMGNKPEAIEEWKAFCNATLKDSEGGIDSECFFDDRRFAFFGEQMYLLPEGITEELLHGLKVKRAGLQLGSCRKNRFLPSHALAHALLPGQLKSTIELQEPERYLRGEAIEAACQDGWASATVCGCILGWGRVSKGVLKNHYPKGLRKN